MYRSRIFSTSVPLVYSWADSKHAISTAMLEAPCSMH